MFALDEGSTHRLLLTTAGRGPVGGGKLTPQPGEEEQTMGIATALARYLTDHGIAYDLVPHPHTETASASAAASRVAADSFAKAVVLRGGDGFMLAVLPASRHIRLRSFGDCLPTMLTWPMRSRSRRSFSIAIRARCRRWRRLRAQCRRRR